MTLDELNAFIDERDGLYRNWKEGSTTDRERMLARMVKLSEEMGELSEAVLSSLGHQRTSKLAAFKPEQVGEEVADVIITVLLVAKALNVDVEDALQKKIKKIHSRDDDWTKGQSI